MGLIKWFKKHKHNKEKVQQEQIDKIKKEKARKKATRKKIIKHQKDTDKAAKKYLGLNMNYHERLEYSKGFDTIYQNSNRVFLGSDCLYPPMNFYVYEPTRDKLKLLKNKIIDTTSPINKLIKMFCEGLAPTADYIHKKCLRLLISLIASDLFDYIDFDGKHLKNSAFADDPKRCKEAINYYVNTYHRNCVDKEKIARAKKAIQLTNVTYIYGSDKDSYKHKGLVQGNNEKELRDNAYDIGANAVINIKRATDLHGRGDEDIMGGFLCGSYGSGSWDLNSTPIYFGTGVYIPSLDKSSKHAKKS